MELNVLQQIADIGGGGGGGGELATPATSFDFCHYIALRMCDASASR